MEQIAMAPDVLDIAFGVFIGYVAARVVLNLFKIILFI